MYLQSSTKPMVLPNTFVRGRTPEISIMWRLLYKTQRDNSYSFLGAASILITPGSKLLNDLKVHVAKRFIR